MNIRINSGIIVGINPQPRKKKSSPTYYDIYMTFPISQNGIRQFSPSISTGITVPVKDWGSKRMKGTGTVASDINRRIRDYQNQAEAILEELRRNENLSCKEVEKVIATQIKVALTGKAPRGQKTVFEARRQSHTLSGVLESLFDDRKPKLSKERARIYRHAVEILVRFFEGSPPLISHITEDDLTEFKQWFADNYRKKNGKPVTPNTATTWFGMIGALFKFATKKKIIAKSPLPEKFRGAFVAAQRQILTTEESLKVLNMDECTMTSTQLVAKCCFTLQLLTGIGYGDLKSLTRDNYKFDREQSKWYLIKNRNKTDVEFKIYLTTRAKRAFDALQGIARGEGVLFKLPSLDFMNRQYKLLAREAGITIKVSSYVLRHSFAVDFMDHHGRIEDLAVILGHKDFETTKIYGKISQRRLQKNIQDLERKSRIHQL